MHTSVRLQEQKVVDEGIAAETVLGGMSVQVQELPLVQSLWVMAFYSPSVEVREGLRWARIERCSMFRVLSSPLKSASSTRSFIKACREELHMFCDLISGFLLARPGSGFVSVRAMELGESGEVRRQTLSPKT